MAVAPRVALTACADYDAARVEAAIRLTVDRLGGMGAFVKPGQRILLKPNLVRAAAPDRAISTHPTVVAAVAKLVVEAGGRPAIVESPGGPYSAAALRLIYRKTEMTWASEAGGAELNYDVATAQVSHPEGQMLHRLDLVQALLDADAVINLPKLKTHNLTTLTLAVKNLFGLVPGSLKISYHAKLQERERFCQGLVDILTYVKPTLNIMDAIVGMEGNGPSGGAPRALGVIIASADALAVDIVSAALVGIAPLRVQTTEVAARRGLTSGRLEDIELVGESLDQLRVADFRMGIEAEMDPGLLPKPLRKLVEIAQPGKYTERKDARGRGLGRALTSGWLWRQLVAVPRVGKGCLGCGVCAKHCPVGAIRMVDKRAQIDTRKCIRCYCCHELCPEEAIELRKPWLGRLLIGL